MIDIYFYNCSEDESIFTSESTIENSNMASETVEATTGFQNSSKATEITNKNSYASNTTEITTNQSESIQTSPLRVEPTTESFYVSHLIVDSTTFVSHISFKAAVPTTGSPRVSPSNVDTTTFGYHISSETAETTTEISHDSQSTATVDRTTVISHISSETTDLTSENSYVSRSTVDPTTISSQISSETAEPTTKSSHVSRSTVGTTTIGSHISPETVDPTTENVNVSQPTVGTTYTFLVSSSTIGSDSSSETTEISTLDSNDVHTFENSIINTSLGVMETTAQSFQSSSDTVNTQTKISHDTVDTTLQNGPTDILITTESGIENGEGDKTFVIYSSTVAGAIRLLFVILVITLGIVHFKGLKTSVKGKCRMMTEPPKLNSDKSSEPADFISVYIVLQRSIK